MKRVESYIDVISQIEKIQEEINTLVENKWFEEADKSALATIMETLMHLIKKYAATQAETEFENTKISLFQSAIKDFKQKYSRTISDSQKKISTFNEQMDSVVNDICNIIIRERGNNKPNLYIKAEEIPIKTNRVYDYEFNSRLGITAIAETYLIDMFNENFNKSTKKSLLEMSQEELATAIPYFKDSPSEALNELKNRVTEHLQNDFGYRFTITKAGEDRTEELSAGFNSKMYFDILSYETSHVRVYLIDQPEDNIA